MTAALEVTTPSDREIAMTRSFNAPRHLVFEALTKPELVQRWLLGPDDWTMPVCEIDLRVGGRYRYVWEHPQYGRMASGGVFREIVPAERIVATEQFEEPWYPGEAIVTTTLVEHDGKTTLTMIVQHESKEVRDKVLKTGMEKGVAASYDRLAVMLEARSV